MPLTDNIDDLIRQYCEAAIAMDNVNDPKQQNEWSDIGHACYKQLRETQEGRARIMALMSDSNPHIRCSAAGHSLAWEPKAARATLEVLRDNDGVCSFEAKMILMEYDKGRLSFDY